MRINRTCSEVPITPVATRGRSYRRADSTTRVMPAVKIAAMLHKDYASHIAIQISVYPDKLMIWNPGQLPTDWTREKLMTKHASHPFNPDIANAFFRAGLIESWGRGIERITEACEQDGCPVPVWMLEPGGLWVTFAYSPDQALQVTDQVTEEIHTLLQVMQGEMTRADIQARLGLRHTPHVRSAYLQPALTAGWVEMTTPDKPTSRLQKYRLTEAGRRLQTALRVGRHAQDAGKGADS